MKGDRRRKAGLSIREETVEKKRGRIEKKDGREELRIRCRGLRENSKRAKKNRRSTLQ